jgi:hypothetical protein
MPDYRTMRERTGGKAIVDLASNLVVLNVRVAICRIVLVLRSGNRPLTVGGVIQFNLPVVRPKDGSGEADITTGPPLGSFTDPGP